MNNISQAALSEAEETEQSAGPGPGRQPAGRGGAAAGRRGAPGTAELFRHPHAGPADRGAGTGGPRNPQPPRRRRGARAPLRPGPAGQMGLDRAHRTAALAGGRRREPVANGNGTRIPLRRGHSASGQFTLPAGGGKTARLDGGHSPHPHHRAGVGTGGGEIETGEFWLWPDRPATTRRQRAVARPVAGGAAVQRGTGAVHRRKHGVAANHLRRRGGGLARV